MPNDLAFLTLLELQYSWEIAIIFMYCRGRISTFDFEKWSQRKKEGFTFEYTSSEDKDLP